MEREKKNLQKNQSIDTTVILSIPAPFKQSMFGSSETRLWELSLCALQSVSVTSWKGQNVWQRYSISRVVSHEFTISNLYPQLVQVLCVEGIDAAMLGLVKLSLALLYWVASRFLAWLFSRMFPAEIKPKLCSAHWSRQFFIQCHGSIKKLVN